MSDEEFYAGRTTKWLRRALKHQVRLVRVRDARASLAEEAANAPQQVRLIEAELRRRG